MLPADIEDDKWYEVKGLSVRLRGDEIKKPGVIRSIRELVRRREEEAEYNRRCFPNRNNIQVFRLCGSSPAFYFRPNFEGVKQVAKDLDMPNSLDTTYVLRYFRGSEFIKYHKRSFLKFKKYAVEAFGILVKRPAGVDLFELERQPLPDGSNYKYPPFYWYEHPYQLIHIWRLRIFKCPIESIQVLVSNPLQPNIPPVVNSEWRWHPHEYPELILYGPYSSFPRRPPKPLSFFKDCCRIVMPELVIGRPREFTDRDFFIQIVVDAYKRPRKGSRTPPSQKLVAARLKINRKTLYNYLKEFSVPWPPC